MKLNVATIAQQVPDEASAYKLLEELRWGTTPVCPHCGSDRRAYFLNPSNGSDRATRTGSRSQRRVWRCADCRKQFSVLTGTIFHGTKIPVRTWLLVVFEMCASKNGVSAREIERKYGLTAKSAWFMTHRIREAMKREPLAGLLRGTVSADETYIGGSEQNRHKDKRVIQTNEPVQIVPGHRTDGWRADKVKVLSLIEEGSGEVRSVVVPDVTGATLRKAIAEQVDMSQTVLQTDELKSYYVLRPELAGHETVNHSEDEYVRYEDGRVITTNRVEGYFSQLKRSLDGTHHHVSVEHLPRYLAEFDFRYSTRKISDGQRMERVMGQVAGRRLTYRPLTGGC
ncbi:MAG: IS1595 family transposase [Actinobacteria bacterium]|nr:IS1595 family transposase [Actinomycetota bacterium]